MAKVVIPAQYIEAIKLFAAKKDMRQYLNNVFLEIHKSDSFLVATNGHILGAFRIKCEQDDVTEPIDAVIPLDMLKSIKNDGIVEIIVGAPVKEDSRSRLITVIANGMTLSGESMDFEYVNWRSVVPKKVSGDVAQFNPEYVSLFGKACTLVCGKKSAAFISIAHNGDRPALVNIGADDFIGLLMPMRSVEVLTAPPVWALSKE
jgi:hypothetical protein